MLNNVLGTAIFACIIVTAGILGSYCRYIFDNELDNKANEGISGTPKILHIIIPGITASAIVPLFLNIGGSQLIDDFLSSSDYQSGFVLFAFCLLASVSARSFVNTLAREALNKSDAAKEQAEKAQATSNETRNIVERQVENLSEALESDNDIDGSAIPDIDTKISNSKLSGDEKIVIKSFLIGKYSKRSISGILRDSDKSNGINVERVRLALIKLISQGIVSQTRSAKTGGELFQLNLAKITDL